MKKTCIFLISGAICASMFLPTLKSISALAESVSNVNFKNFILNDTKEFADDFNRKIVDNAEDIENIDETSFLRATSIQHTREVYNLINDEYNTYIDFDNENGYMLLDSNNVMYNFSTRGDLDYIRNYNGTVYYDNKGYCFLDNETNNFVLFDETEAQVDDEVSYSQPVRPTNTEPIYDINIESHLYSEYSDILTSLDNGTYRVLDVSKENMVLDNSFSYESQLKTSVYYDSNGSEGNCVIHSAWQILNYWSLNKNVNFPKGYLIGSYVSDPVYSNLAGTGYSVNAALQPNGGSTYFKLPKLYYDLRNIMVRDYGYTVNGAAYSDMINAIKEVSTNYNYTATVTSFSTSYNTTYNYILNDYPIWMKINNDINYENHAVAVVGTRRYKVYYSTGNMTGYKYIVYFKLADGHARTHTWIDMPNLSVDTNTATHRRFSSSLEYLINIV